MVLLLSNVVGEKENHRILEFVVVHLAWEEGKCGGRKIQRFPPGRFSIESKCSHCTVNHLLHMSVEPSWTSPATVPNITGVIYHRFAIQKVLGFWTYTPFGLLLVVGDSNRIYSMVCTPILSDVVAILP